MSHAVKSAANAAGAKAKPPGRGVIRRAHPRSSKRCVFPVARKMVVKASSSFKVTQPILPVAVPEPAATTAMLERLAVDALDAKSLEQLRAKIANDTEKVALLEKLQDRPVSNAGLSELGKSLLRLVFNRAKPFLKMQRHRQVFMLLTDYGPHWWRASKLVSKYRRESVI